VPTTKLTKTKDRFKSGSPVLANDSNISKWAILAFGSIPGADRRDGVISF
jgi:hypothetical protein